MSLSTSNCTSSSPPPFMPHPLTRQPTVDSVLSWWSDRNPPGPNINLHAVAKPLMRRMYHRAALDYISNNRGVSLSTETMEIYSSYLGYKYVFPSTKAAILEELAQMLQVSVEHDARTRPGQGTDVQDSGIFAIPREHSDGNLQYISLSSAYITLAFLIYRVSGEDPWVASLAERVLTWVVKWPEGARTAVDANVVECATELLEAPMIKTQEWACQLLGRLARNKSTGPAVLEINPCTTLAFLLGHSNLGVIESAAYALLWSANSPDGAQAVVDSNALDCTMGLLRISSGLVLARTCTLLDHLVAHKSTASAVLSLYYCTQLVHNSPTVRSNALSTLAKISEHPEGIADLAGTDILAGITDLMESPDQQEKFHTCVILRNLARHKPGWHVVFVDS
ncbi:armadillo-type protein [Mycena vulgaris]|nr:armadillo-type protein [Mycena vulgaris]KAJ6564921.1 armadillo-type protein [Mycena vulgaris]